MATFRLRWELLPWNNVRLVQQEHFVRQWELPRRQNVMQVFLMTKSLAITPLNASFVPKDFFVDQEHQHHHRAKKERGQI
jgi:hypothetical protein